MKFKKSKGISFVLSCAIFASMFSITAEASLDYKDKDIIDSIKIMLDKKEEYFKSKIRIFKDMGNHWSDITVGKLVDFGVVNGYEDGNFKADNTVTRAEFSTMISKVFKIKGNENKFFEDTKKHWAKDSIGSLIENKIIIMDEYESEYHPDKNITRLEMTKMLVRSMGLDKEASERISKDTSFADDKDIPSKDKGYVFVAIEKGLIKGYKDNTFKPNGEATRGEACTIITNMLHSISGVEKVDTVDTNVNKAEYLPKVNFEQEGLSLNVKNNIGKWMENGNVGEIIKADVNQFPLEYGNIVITGIERIPYNNKSPFYKVPGWQTDAIIIHAYPIKDNDKNGIVKGYSLDSLRVCMFSKNGGFLNTNNIPFEDKSLVNKLKSKYPNLIEGDFARANVGQKFSTIYLATDDFSLNNLKKIILQDTYNSTSNVLEIDMSQVK